MDPRTVAFHMGVHCLFRIYLEVHYPGDVLGGAILGLMAEWTTGMDGS
ncbi:MAG: hypothetical protein R2758_04555 [Bacteroidales bacterium]